MVCAHGVDSPFHTTAINCCLPVMSMPSWHDSPSYPCASPSAERYLFVLSFEQQTLVFVLSTCTWLNTISIRLSGMNLSYLFAPQFHSLAEHVFGFVASLAVHPSILFGSSLISQFQLNTWFGFPVEC